MVDRVYKFGCRAPLEHALALQLLGQAWNYRDDLRRAYNTHRRTRREAWRHVAEAEHVRAWERYEAARTDSAHVLCREKHLTYRSEKDALNEAIRHARRRRGHLLDCGTYWLLEGEALQAGKTPGLDPLRIEPFDVTGRIGAEIQSRDQFPTAEWEHGRVYLTAPDERKHAELRIFVGRKKDRRSITWPIKLHRSFPDGAIVKQVAMQRTRIGHRYRWEALITISYEPALRDEAAKGAVGIDIGWRKTASGTRVAAWSGSDGAHGTIEIDTIDAFLYSDSIRSFRDENFDTAKAYAAEKGLAQHAKKWRDKSRMHRLSERTSDLGLSLWRERDKHLEDIEASVRTNAQRRRLDLFRATIGDLAKQYRYFAIEDMPMATWVGEGETHAKERKRSSAALSLLQNVITQRAGAERVDWIDSVDSTRTCSSCAVVRPESVGPQLRWMCSSCGAEHDQDENAANVLRSRCERWIDAGNTPRARKRKPPKKKEKKNVDGIATGDEIRMVITPRDLIAEAAE
jgi:transposase